MSEAVPDLAFGRTWPDRDTFRELARDRRVIPVVRRLLADAETPLGVYRKLARDEPGTFLLESAEHGGVWSRYSIVGARASATLTEVEGEAYWIGQPPVGVPTSGDPTVALRDTVAALRTPALDGLPPLTGGLVGAMTYDVVRRWERLPDDCVDDLGLPELTMMLATDLAVLDHADGSLLLVANAVNRDDTDDRVDEAWADAVERLDRMVALLAAPAASTVGVPGDEDPKVRTQLFESEYAAMVERAKEAVRAGDVFQVVPSQRYEIDCPADALEVYRVLRASNPSPYMYLLRLPTVDGQAYDVVGSSPEALVKVDGRQVMTHPIAGTRPRGATPEQDVAHAESLLADAKERAEHLMLVDLARNDLARVCDAGTVEVLDFMQVERYSHVMHLVSTVVGRLRDDRTAYDALVATFPAGTLSGAPKVRAMELIDEMETTRRGLYGGTVGYLDFAGDLDMAIAIRTAVIRDGTAYVQAGGGVVADSDPVAEHQESVNKSMAVLRAVAAASGLRQVT
ncbi:anthranilate synthase component I [Angustibacter peucedani]